MQIWFSHLHLLLPSGLFLSDFSNPVWVSLFSHTAYILSPSKHPWFSYPLNIWCGIKIIELLTSWVSVWISLLQHKPTFPAHHNNTDLITLKYLLWNKNYGAPYKLITSYNHVTRSDSFRKFCLWKNIKETLLYLGIWPREVRQKCNDVSEGPTPPILLFLLLLLIIINIQD